MAGNSEGESKIGRLKNRREDNIKIDIKYMVWKGIDIYYSGTLALCFVNRIIKLRAPKRRTTS